MSSELYDDELDRFTASGQVNSPNYFEDSEQIDEIEDSQASYSNEENEINQNEFYVRGLKEIEGLGLVDIGNWANWSVSSHKQGSSVKELREDNPNVFWQSDGVYPHTLNIHFNKKVNVERLSLFTNYHLDESYTPSKILVLAGNGPHDLQEVATVELTKPTGWSHIIFNGIRADGVLKCFYIRLVILANHQDGKDTHIRSIKIFQKVGNEINEKMVRFTSIKLMSESVIR